MSNPPQHQLIFRDLGFDQGTKSISRLEENWASREIKLTSDELKEMRQLIDNANIKGQRYPEAAMKHVEK